MNTNQTITGYIKIIEKTQSIFVGGNKTSRIIKRRDEIVLDLTLRDAKFVYYYDDPNAKFFMPPPCFIRDLIPPNDCSATIELLCGQDVCIPTGFGSPVTVGRPGRDDDDDEDDFDISDPDPPLTGCANPPCTGGPPCLNPPCFSGGCVNPPCNQDDCQDDEQYNEETGECDPPECENPVGTGSCCFNGNDTGNCVYRTCFQVRVGGGRQCCTEGTLTDSPDCPCLIDGECRIVCEECFTPNLALCAVTTRHCYSGQNSDGSLRFGDLELDPGSGEFQGPSGRPDLPESSCPTPETEGGQCGCVVCSCPSHPDGDVSDDPDGAGYTPGGGGGSSSSICEDENGYYSMGGSVYRICSCSPCAAGSNGKASYTSISIPSCIVHRKPGQGRVGELPQPPSQFPPPPEYGFIWETDPGLPVGGPSSSCDCG